MSINIHNYEEYFILYMDNELSSEDRSLVEAFVLQHPELKEELDTLLHYKLVPDTSIVFADKEELLKKNGHSLITVSNYEEWLTMYADDELSSEQKYAVEQFVAEHPFAKRDLELVLKTRLQPEQIVFPDKKSLYRTEEKRRIIPFAWRAAAAILILILGLSAFLLFNNKTGNGATEVANKSTKTGEQQGPGNIDNEVPAQKDQQLVNVQEEKQTPVETINQNESTIITTNKANNNSSVASTEKNKQPNPVLQKDQQEAPKIDDAVAVENNIKPSNNLPQPLNNRVIAETNPVNTTDIADVSPKAKNDAMEEADIVTKTDASSSDYIYTSNEKKNKNRGIFRKIARTFEKRTSIDPTDDNKLLVGGLAIKLK